MQRASSRLDAVAGPTVALLFCAAVWFAYPFHRVFQFNPDEGVTAMKALLRARGVPMYTQIWSDQPPLFTEFLAPWMQIGGGDVDHGRLLTLSFGALLVFAVYESGRLLGGHRAAIVSVVVLCLSPYFVRLSVSLMIGLPALAFATLSVLGCLHYGASGKRSALAGSAVAFGASLATKLFVAPIGVVLFGLLLFRSRPGVGFRTAVGWCALAGLAFALLMSLLGGSGATAQLLGPHVGAQLMMTSSGGPESLHRDLWANAPLLLLAAAGALVVLSAPTPARVAVVTWFGLYLAILMVHRPYWYHHQILLSVPAALLAGQTVGWESTPAAIGRWGAACARLLAGVTLVFLVEATMIHGLADPQVPIAYHADLGRIVEEMRRFGPLTDTVLTDVPMFAVRAALPVEPAFAVVTQKRMAVGKLDPADFLQRIHAGAPEQVVLGNRFPKKARREMIAALGAKYRLVAASHWPPRPALFVRQDVLAAGYGSGQPHPTRAVAAP